MFSCAQGGRAGPGGISQKNSRAKLLAFFGRQLRCVVTLEACAGAHHWRRELARLRHDVWLIPPAYVKPLAKRQKNDAADAEAISEAAQRLTMRYVAVKGEAQQAGALVFRARDLAVRQLVWRRAARPVNSAQLPVGRRGRGRRRRS
jgi:transposase